MANKTGEKLFEKAPFGYRIEDVDRYIEQQNARIHTLEAEKTDLMGKMKILAEKINEYRADESNMKDALLGAQKMGTAIVKDAQAKAEAMLSDAKNRSDRMLYEAELSSNEAVGGIRAQVEHEKLLLAKMQKEVADFKARLQSLYKVHINAINSLPDMDPETEEFYNTRIKAQVTQAMGQEPPAEEPAPLQAAEPPVKEQAQAEPETPPPAGEPASQAEAQEEPDKPRMPDKEASTVRFEKQSKNKEAPKQEEKVEETAQPPKTEKPAPTINRPSHKPSFEEKFGDLKFGKHNPPKQN